MNELVMPSLGADMDAGTLVEWRVKPGDAVHRGQIVALVETQKATMEVECWHDGVVSELLLEPGARVPVGTVMARLNGVSAPVSTAAAPPPPVASVEHRVPSSPAARRLARERGVDLAHIAGTGRHGVILARDVPAIATAPQQPAPAPSPAPAPAIVPAIVPARPSPRTLSPLREAIGAAMARSKREIPHYYLARTASMRRATEWLTRTNAALPIGERILPAALYLRAVALALWDVPELNGTFGPDGFQPSEPVHIGFAIALRGGGVLAPAIHDADQKSVPELMADLRDLVRRTRAGTVRASELTDPTITITSVGDRGADAVWGVINPPQVAIVGVGALVDRPWVEGGAVTVHPTVTLTLSADHRVTDGHRGGVFLAAVDHHLQELERP